MKRRVPLRADPAKLDAWRKRSAKLKRAGRIKARRKDKRERDAYVARVYGSDERLRAIKALPCAVPGCDTRPSENHHIRGGGMGRKADWRNVVPLCAEHHFTYHTSCGSVAAFDKRFGTDLRALAERLAEEIKP